VKAPGFYFSGMQALSRKVLKEFQTRTGELSDIQRSRVWCLVHRNPYVSGASTVEVLDRCAPLCQQQQRKWYQGWL